MDLHLFTWMLVMHFTTTTTLQPPAQPFSPSPLWLPWICTSCISPRLQHYNHRHNHSHHHHYDRHGYAPNALHHNCNTTTTGTTIHAITTKTAMDLLLMHFTTTTTLQPTAQPFTPSTLSPPWICTSLDGCLWNIHLIIDILVAPIIDVVPWTNSMCLLGKKG